MNYSNIPTIDGHVHVYTPKCLDYFEKYRAENAFDAINVACLCNLNEEMANDATQNILAAIFKLKNPHIYAHGGLVYPEFPVPTTIPDEYDFEAQARELLAMGFDGIKMLEAKPTVRKMTKMPIDDPKFDGFYAYLEKEHVHIVSHTADPETFWMKDKAPEFSFIEGWFYGDGTFPTKQSLYDEVDRVLEKYPDLCFTLPHFYFLSDFPKQADEFLDAHPNVFFDLTPGREMYDNFTRRHDKFCDLFERRYDRIMFGTDMTSSEFQGSPADMISAIKRFLCTDDEFEYWDFAIRGVDLSEDKAKAILHDNFISRVGANPKPIDRALLARYIEKHVEGIRSDDARKFILDFAESEL